MGRISGRRAASRAVEEPNAQGGRQEAGVDRVHRMELQYDGTGLHGWAKQGSLPTVEGSLEAALQTVLGTVPALAVAGRTDAGVHARRQVVSLTLPARTDLPRLMRSLNALTPRGIAVTRLAPAPPGFNAHKDALSRLYRYYVCAAPVVPPFLVHYCWHVPFELDMDLVRACAAAVVGRHDFTAFTPAHTEHLFFERTVLRCDWKRETAGLGALGPGAAGTRSRGVFYLEIEANAFLRHMVRTLVGTIIDIGQGRRSLDDLAQLLEGSHRLEAGPTAVPHGLFFWDVRYREMGARASGN